MIYVFCFVNIIFWRKHFREIVSVLLLGADGYQFFVKPLGLWIIHNNQMGAWRRETRMYERRIASANPRSVCTFIVWEIEPLYVICFGAVIQ